LQELPDVPLFLSLHNLCATLKCTSPSAIIFRSAVINAGYRISGTHVNPLGLKSDAPMDVIWDIMRCWVIDHTCLKPFLFIYMLSLFCCRIEFFWHVYKTLQNKHIAPFKDATSRTYLFCLGLLGKFIKKWFGFLLIVHWLSLPSGKKSSSEASASRSTRQHHTCKGTSSTGMLIIKDLVSCKM